MLAGTSAGHTRRMTDSARPFEPTTQIWPAENTPATVRCLYVSAHIPAYPPESTVVYADPPSRVDKKNPAW